ncbi:hypothetical protein [Clostridium botulinum]|uniref:hypothetical protein n=1 Tax=Clostridium botulinum TaxID=1491 RepID=UPI003DA68E31
MSYSKLVNSCVGILAKSRYKATKKILDVIYNLENLIEHAIIEEVEKGAYIKIYIKYVRVNVSCLQN